MHPFRAALDSNLPQGPHEWVTLRRIVGKGNNTQNIDCRCLARVDKASLQEIAAGISQSEFIVILSPTGIYDAQWPGGTVERSPPFNPDPQIPRENSDKLISQGRLHAIVYVDVKIIDGEMVRINMRVTG